MKALEDIKKISGVALLEEGVDGLLVQLSHNETLFTIVISNGLGWDHVSVSTGRRIPTWDEMEYVKRLIFKPEETAMQLHVPCDEHITIHPYCLHMWRCHKIEAPMPPRWMV